MDDDNAGGVDVAGGVDGAGILAVLWTLAVLWVVAVVTEVNALLVASKGMLGICVGYGGYG